ncbi:hypothetical protein OnM2_c2149o208 [Erysiphe neolycopersici]|uniref:Uncharacterized protein n=1 Tax=Erysiphe neolycopersici TaxID=212602 RepID=A0A420I195_9PEZI|nr:hypothetical protein OnM2_c2149o208 [Erysiphe neolycopersici]
MKFPTLMSLFLTCFPFSPHLLYFKNVKYYLYSKYNYWYKSSFFPDALYNEAIEGKLSVKNSVFRNKDHKILVFGRLISLLSKSAINKLIQQI